MIESAEEFVRLRLSAQPEEYGRAAEDEASEHVCFDVIARYPDMRKWVAHNKKIPMAVLKKLASDSDPMVRFTVAMKRKLSSELIEQLSKDTDESIRSQIARHPRSPLAVVQKLASDAEPRVREIAERVLVSNKNAARDASHP
ncbi:hypothetical protein BH11VER1_BH11VER1_17840 [soil metagenome]